MVQELLNALRIVHQLENDRTVTIDTLEERVSAASGIQPEVILRASKSHGGMYLCWALYYLYHQQGLGYRVIAQRTNRPEHTVIRNGVLQLQKYLRRYEDDERVTGIERTERNE